MQSLVVLIVVALGAYVWVRRTRRRRARWLRRLNLPGTWISQGETRETLELSGEPGQGRFRMPDGAGDWRLQGNILELAFDGGELRKLDLTFYDVGKIGLEAAPGQRRFYEKSAANVIPLHKRA